MSRRSIIFSIIMVLMTACSSGVGSATAQKNPVQGAGEVENAGGTETIAAGRLRDTVFSLVSSAENSSLDYRAQYAYIEDIGDGRGYTAGVIGFTSGTGDLLLVVQEYVALKPARTPAQGGDEAKYLVAFLSARKIIMKKEAAHSDLSRLNAQKKCIAEKNWSLSRPLAWTMYGDDFVLE